MEVTTERAGVDYIALAKVHHIDVDVSCQALLCRFGQITSSLTLACLFLDCNQSTDNCGCRIPGK